MSEWLRVKEAAEFANVGERTFRMWLQEKGLKHSKICGLILIKISDINDFIDTFSKENDLGKEINQTVDQVIEEMKR